MAGSALFPPWFKLSAFRRDGIVWSIRVRFRWSLAGSLQANVVVALWTVTVWRWSRKGDFVGESQGMGRTLRAGAGPGCQLQFSVSQGALDIGTLRVLNMYLIDHLP